MMGWAGIGGGGQEVGARAHCSRSSLAVFYFSQIL